MILFAILLSSTLILLSASTSPKNCSFTTTTVTCTGTVPKVVPNETNEVVLLAPIEFTARIFCNVTWTNVRKLSLIYLRYRAYLFDHLFDCLGHIESLNINGSIWVVTGNAFYGLDNVTTLDLSDSSVDQKQLQKLFSLQTTIEKLTNLIVSNDGVPLEINQHLISALSPRPIKHLDFSNNDVTFNFHNSSQLCETLKTLDLRRSSISVKHLPRLCPSLQFVDLSENFNLTRSLKFCKEHVLLKIPSFYSARVMVLNRILLGEDGFRMSACTATFYHSELIRNLYFSHNNIPKFGIWFDFSFVFPFIVPHLEYICLSHNNIADIDKGALSLLPNVKSVDLSFNNLHKMQNFEGIMPYLFQRNLYLSSVDLATNGLSYLPDKTFSLNSRLQEIRLSNNTFKQLSLNFSQLYSLQILDLRFNQIQYLKLQSRNKVEEFYQKRTEGGNETKDEFQILLEGNPFTCDCIALQFLRWFQQSPIFNASYQCFSNGNVFPMTETAVQVSEENCERPKRKLRTILLSTILPGSTLIGTIIVASFLYKRRKKQKRIKLLSEKIRLIREDRAGYKFLVFLSFSDMDAQFVGNNVYHQLQVCYN